MSYYFGMKELWKIGEVIYCYYSELFGLVEVLGYELRELARNRKFKVVKVRNIHTQRVSTLNQAWMDCPLDKVC